LPLGPWFFFADDYLVLVSGILDLCFLCALIQAGCAADFRAGSDRRGVDVGAKVDPFYARQL
jgi:hypothetical protein